MQEWVEGLGCVWLRMGGCSRTFVVGVGLEFRFGDLVGQELKLNMLVDGVGWRWSTGVGSDYEFILAVDVIEVLQSYEMQRQVYHYLSEVSQSKVLYRKIEVLCHGELCEWCTCVAKIT